MNKGLEALKDLYKLRAEMLEEKVCHKDSKWQENIKIYDRWGDNLIRIEKELKALEIINENLKYGYVFIGYDKDNKPLFQFAGAQLYEEIKKHTTY